MDNPIARGQHKQQRCLFEVNGERNPAEYQDSLEDGEGLDLEARATSTDTITRHDTDGKASEQDFVYVDGDINQDSGDALDVRSEATAIDWFWWFPWNEATSEAYSNANVWVDGDVLSADADGIDLRLKAIEGWGNTSAEAEALVGVDGSVTGAGNGIKVRMTDGTNAIVYVSENVTGENGSGLNIAGGYDAEALVIVEGIVEGYDSAIKINGDVVPTIIVGELKVADENGKLIDATDEQASQIYYIVTDNDNIIDGTQTKEGYEVAQNGDILKAVVDADHELDYDETLNGQNYEVTKVGDGVYEIKVYEGGHLKFSLKAKTITPVAETYTGYILMKGNVNDDVQPFGTVEMRASHLARVILSNRDYYKVLELNTDYNTEATDRGLLNFQFISEYLQSLEYPENYSLQFVTTEGDVYTFMVNIEANGDYVVSC